MTGGAVRHLKRILIERTFGLLSRLIDGLACRLPAGAATADVLVVRLDALGDFLLWSDAARHLADHYRGQGRRVVLLANAAWSALVPALDAFDDVWPLDRRRFLFQPRYRFRMMRRLRRAGFAIAVQPTFSRETLVGDAAVRAAGRIERIGQAGDRTNQNAAEAARADRWYTRLVPAGPDALTELRRNAHFLRGLGLDAVPAIGRLPCLPPADTHLPGGDYAVLIPGAGWNARCWPAEHFARLAERLVAATGWTIVLAGGPGDRAAAKAVVALSRVAVADWVGRTGLADLAHILGRARLVLSNETGPLHLAAVMGTPSVGILGGGHFGRFVPYGDDLQDKAASPRVLYHSMDCFGCNWHCRYPRNEDQPFACIAAVTVEAVWDEVRRVLDNG